MRVSRSSGLGNAWRSSSRTGVMLRLNDAGPGGRFGPVRRSGAGDAAGSGPKGRGKGYGVHTAHTHRTAVARRDGPIAPSDYTTTTTCWCAPTCVSPACVGVFRIVGRAVGRQGERGGGGGERGSLEL